MHRSDRYAVERYLPPLEPAAGPDADVDLAVFLANYGTEMQWLGDDPVRRALITRGDHHSGLVSEFVGCGRCLSGLLLSGGSCDG